LARAYFDTTAAKRQVSQDIPVEPTEREKDLTAAFREYLAVHAAQRPIVRRFRREYLPDGRLYTDDHDISLLLEEQHVAKAGTTNLQQYLDENRGKPDDWAVRFEFSTKPPPGNDSGLMTWKELAEQFAEEEIDQERQMEEDWWGKGRATEVSWYDFLDGDPTEEDVAEERERQKEWEGHFGTQLEILGEWLAAKYPWENVGDAVVFLISGHHGWRSPSAQSPTWETRPTLLRSRRGSQRRLSCEHIVRSERRHPGTRQYGSCASSRGKRTTMATSLPGPHCAIGGTRQTQTRSSRIGAPFVRPTDGL
jgi:hypothetical protein